ncbi:MAG TPA: GNAT family N-acetyltransferase [Dyella sp.]|uniref:GNAT family N-acetyltransferase n=1 Tax=Dyella sp. TaxID=1869338 RepID=UPI002BC06E10|nr:GNAT family N-acetyltransferase [Dyella sp.]HUB88597.1 GNAT family N-acetyltransferase [Dyella sp.]
MIEIARAVQADEDEVHMLLRACGLSTHDIFSPGAAYWVARNGAGPVGFCGLEWGDAAALLRSVSVHHEYRGRGVARRLVEAAIAETQARSIKRIYLFSKDTGRFFETLGWCEVPVDEASEVMQAAPQVRHYHHVGWYPNERAFRRDV